MSTLGGYFGPLPGRRRLNGAGVPFNPIQSNPAAWYDASRYASIYGYNGAASFASASSQTLTKATPWTTTGAVTYSFWLNTTTISVRFGVFGDGSSNGPYAEFNGTGLIKFAVNGVTANASDGIQTNTASPSYRMTAGTGVNLTGPATNIFSVVNTVWNGASSLWQLDDNAPANPNVGTNNFGGLCVGARGDGAAQKAVTMGELIAYSTAESPSQINKLAAYLKAKWGTP